MSQHHRTVAAALIILLLLLVATAALGADPSAEPVLEGGDLRSDGGGPGLVGNPLLILGAVVALGSATAVVTVALIRLTRRDDG